MTTKCDEIFARYAFIHQTTGEQGILIEKFKESHEEVQSLLQCENQVSDLYKEYLNK